MGLELQSSQKSKVSSLHFSNLNNILFFVLLYLHIKLNSVQFLFYVRRERGKKKGGREVSDNHHDSTSFHLFFIYTLLLVITQVVITSIWVGSDRFILCKPSGNSPKSIKLIYYLHSHQNFNYLLHPYHQKLTEVIVKVSIKQSFKV